MRQLGRVGKGESKGGELRQVCQRCRENRFLLLLDIPEERPIEGTEHSRSRGRWKHVAANCGQRSQHLARLHILLPAKQRYLPEIYFWEVLYLN